MTSNLSKCAVVFLQKGSSSVKNFVDHRTQAKMSVGGPLRARPSPPDVPPVVFLKCRKNVRCWATEHKRSNFGDAFCTRGQQRRWNFCETFRAPPPPPWKCKHTWLMLFFFFPARTKGNLSHASFHSAFVFYPCISVPLPFIFILPPLLRLLLQHPLLLQPAIYHLRSPRWSGSLNLCIPPPRFSHIYSSPHFSLLHAPC